MNEKIKQFGEQAIHYAASKPMPELKDRDLYLDNLFEKFAELIVQHCIGVCEEMAAQCGGLPGDGALARDCAHWIRKDFGVEE
jgi:hypothetical protein